MVGYGEIRYKDDASFYGWMGQTPYMISSLQHTLEEIQHPRLLSVTITHKDELYQVLQTFCSRRRTPMFEARVAELEALAQQHGLDFPPPLSRSCHTIS